MSRIPDPGYYTMDEALKLAPEPKHWEIGGISAFLLLMGITGLPSMTDMETWSLKVPESLFWNLLSTTAIIVGLLGFCLLYHRHNTHNTPLYRMRKSPEGKLLLRRAQTLSCLERDLHRGGICADVTDRERVAEARKELCEQQTRLLHSFGG
jgi:hypothetical protein